MHSFGCRICRPNRLFKRIANGRDAEHAPARGQERIAVLFCARDIAVRSGLLAHRDGKAALILFGVALGREHDAAGGTGRKFHARVRERTVRRRLHDGEQVAFEQRQHRLRLRQA